MKLARLVDVPTFTRRFGPPNGPTTAGDGGVIAGPYWAFRFNNPYLLDCLPVLAGVESPR